MNPVNTVYTVCCSKGSRLVQGEACSGRRKYDACVTVAQSAAWAGKDAAGELKKKKKGGGEAGERGERKWKTGRVEGSRMRRAEAAK